MRIGIGFDAHRLAEGLPLVLGGVIIPFHQGLRGWSDADVVVHAIMDAMLGAAALGDIGLHFPSGDPAFDGISSITLLERTRLILGEQGWRIVNIDATIVAERPLISPFIEQMRDNIGRALSVDKALVGMKATTSDGLGFTGRAEGIAAYSVALVEHNE